MAVTSSPRPGTSRIRRFGRSRAIVVAVAMLAGSVATMPSASADVLRPNVDLGAPGGGGISVAELLIGGNGTSLADHRAGFPIGPTAF